MAENLQPSGWWLVVPPAFLAGFAQPQQSKEYGFVPSAVNEALHLSGK